MSSIEEAHIEDEEPKSEKEKRDWYVRRVERDMSGSTLTKPTVKCDFGYLDSEIIKKRKEDIETLKRVFINNNKTDWELSGYRIDDNFKGFITIAKRLPDGRRDWESDTKIEFAHYNEFLLRIEVLNGNVLKENDSKRAK